MGGASPLVGRRENYRVSMYRNLKVSFASVKISAFFAFFARHAFMVSKSSHSFFFLGPPIMAITVAHWGLIPKNVCRLFNPSVLHVLCQNNVNVPINGKYAATASKHKTCQLYFLRPAQLPLSIPPLSLLHLLVCVLFNQMCVHCFRGEGIAVCHARNCCSARHCESNLSRETVGACMKRFAQTVFRNTTTLVPTVVVAAVLVVKA